MQGNLSGSNGQLSTVKLRSWRLPHSRRFCLEVAKSKKGLFLTMMSRGLRVMWWWWSSCKFTWTERFWWLTCYHPWTCVYGGRSKGNTRRLARRRVWGQWICLLRCIRALFARLCGKCRNSRCCGHRSLSFSKYWSQQWKSPYLWASKVSNMTKKLSHRKYFSFQCSPKYPVSNLSAWRHWNFPTCWW